MLAAAFFVVGLRSRLRGAAMFGVFALFWAIQVATSNFAVAADSAGNAQTLYLLSMAFLVPLPYLLLSFAAAQGHRPDSLSWRMIRTISLALAASVALVAAVDLPFLLEGVTTAPSGHYAQWGPGMTWMVSLPFFVALGTALVTLYTAFATSPTRRTARAHAAIVVGLGLYVAFVAGKFVTYYGVTATTGTLALSGATTQLPYFLLFTAMAVTVAALAVHAWSQQRYRIAAALLVPLAWGAIEAALMLGPLQGLRTEGLWRLAGSGIVGYGLAQWWIPGLARHTPSAVRAGGASMAIVAITGLAIGATATPTTGLFASTAMGAATASAIGVPAVQLVRRLDHRARRPRRQTPTYTNRIETYRAALEQALARGDPSYDDAFLARLRSRFLISDDEHKILEHLARQAVVVHRGRDEQGDVSYERLRLLGQGAAARTWLARDRATDDLVVLKEPMAAWLSDPRLRRLALREAHVAADIAHPNVVNVKEVMDSDHGPIMVMEYVDGGSLADWLHSRGVLPAEEAVNVMTDVLSGLHALHRRGLVHQDIKPANILIGSDGQARIADLGLARPVSEASTLTDPGNLPAGGTLPYMAPERRGGTEPGSIASDLYACAAVLFECIHGAPPGRSTTRHPIPSNLQNVIDWGLGTDPELRPGSAKQLAEALAEAVQA